MHNSLRIPLIAAGLALPVIIAAVVTQYTAPAPPAMEKAPPPVRGNEENIKQWVPLQSNISVPTAAPPDLEKPSTAAPLDSGPSMMFEAEKLRVRQRLEKLEKMTEADFALDQKDKPKPSGAPPLTLDRARNRTRIRLLQLENMTAEQWADEQRERFKSGKDLDRLSPTQRQMMEQQLKMDEMRKAVQMPDKPAGAP